MGVIYCHLLVVFHCLHYCAVGTVCGCNMLAVFVLFLLGTVCGSDVLVVFVLFLLGTVCGCDMLVVFVLFF